ncbi:MAG: ATP-binding protein [Bacteroidetes bacterium]|nr:ATP-binding protein [Bacteroidota bacterium]
MKEKLVRINNNLSELEKIVSRVESIAEEWNIPPKLVFHINLVIEELVTNTISYGYVDIADGKHEIEIRFSLDNTSLTIILIDNAREFNPLQMSDPQDLDKPIKERERGGLGIFLVKKFVDDLEYKRENGRNIIILKKTLTLE